MTILGFFLAVFLHSAHAQPLPPLPARPLIPIPRCRVPEFDPLLSVDFPRTFWLQSFGTSGAQYRHATVEDFGSVNGLPLTLTAPTSRMADHIRIRGIIETSGFPLTLQARIIEFTPDSRIVGYVDGRPPSAPAHVPDVAGPQQGGVIGLPGEAGYATPGPITLVAMYVAGHPIIQGKGQKGGTGGQGGKGGIGARGGTGEAADCTDWPGGHDGRDGGQGGQGATGGQGGPGGPGGAPIPVYFRMGSFTNALENASDVVSLPGDGGDGGAGGVGGDGGRGGDGGAGGSGWMITCDPGNTGLTGPNGGVGLTGTTGIVSTIPAHVERTLFSDLFREREQVFREAYWVHLWRSLSLRLEEFTRVSLRVPLAADNRPILPLGLRYPNAPTEHDVSTGLQIMHTAADRLWRDLGVFPFFGSLGASNGGYRAVMSVARCETNDRQALTGRAGLLAVLLDARDIYSQFSRGGYDHLWTPVLERINLRLRELQPVIFARLRTACERYETAVARHATDLLGVPLYSIPICEGQDTAQMDYLLMPQTAPGGTP